MPIDKLKSKSIDSEENQQIYSIFRKYALQ